MRLGVEVSEVSGAAKNGREATDSADLLVVRDSSNVQIAGCLVTAAEDPVALVAGVEVAGNSKAVVVRGNLIAAGSQGAVLGNSEAVSAGENRTPE